MLEAIGLNVGRRAPDAAWSYQHGRAWPPGQRRRCARLLLRTQTASWPACRRRAVKRYSCLRSMASKGGGCPGGANPVEAWGRVLHVAPAPGSKACANGCPIQHGKTLARPSRRAVPRATTARSIPRPDHERPTSSCVLEPPHVFHGMRGRSILDSPTWHYAPGELLSPTRSLEQAPDAVDAGDREMGGWKKWHAVSPDCDRIGTNARHTCTSMSRTRHPRSSAAATPARGVAPLARREAARGAMYAERSPSTRRVTT
jgi:hypothetical protein